MELNSPPSNVNERLVQVVEQGPQEVNNQLNLLNNQWTVGRVSKGLGGLIILIGLILGHFVSSWWLLLSLAGALGFIQYFFVPTSPLESLLKSMGLRTGSEITEEKVALKTLRGDFQKAPSIHQIEDRDAISRLEGEGGIAASDVKKVDVKEAVPQIMEASSLPVPQ